MISYKRTIVSYTFPLGMALVSVYQVFKVPFYFQLIYGATLLLCVFQLGWILFHKKAIIVTDQEIRYFDNFFKIKIFKKDEIDFIEVSKNSFSKVNIFLKNNPKTISVDQFWVSFSNPNVFEKSLLKG